MKDKLLMIVFILVLGSILTASLLAVDSFTDPLIRKNVELKTTTNVLIALEIPSSDANIDVVFAENVEIKEWEGKEFFIARNGDTAFEYEGSGLWGPINGIIALRADLETIKGITLIHQEETPGLGGRIGEAWYLEGFKDRKVEPPFRLGAAGKESTGNTVDAISGATLTSAAFLEILNDQIGENLRIIRGGAE